jgi:hypothetical protein
MMIIINSCKQNDIDVRVDDGNELIMDNGGVDGRCINYFLRPKIEPNALAILLFGGAAFAGASVDDGVSIVATTGVVPLDVDVVDAVEEVAVVTGAVAVIVGVVVAARVDDGNGNDGTMEGSFCVISTKNPVSASQTDTKIHMIK